MTAAQDSAIRELHADIPTRPGHWTANLEGSYPTLSDLKSLDNLGTPWLYIDRGWREMQLSPHCNVEDTRWILRERGLPIVGPPPAEFACEIPAEMLRANARSRIERFLPELTSWADFDIVWTQRYAMESMCRMLYTLVTGTITSKRAALEWAHQKLDPAWRELITRAVADRSLTWNDPSDPALVNPTLEFLNYAQTWAATR